MRSKTVSFLGGLAVFLLSVSLAHAEDLLPSPSPKPVLRLQGQNPQPTAGTPKRSPDPLPPPPISISSAVPRTESVPETKSMGTGLYSGFSVLLATPFLRETVYETRFSSLGLQFLYALPITALKDGPHGFALEFGLIATHSRLSLSLPAIEFTHISFSIPARVRLIFSTGNFRWELYAGAVFEAFELNSRPAPDGGFNSVLRFVLDGGAGVSYPLFSENTRLRLLIGYYSAALGAEWAL